jgi:hypothetical protein
MSQFSLLTFLFIVMSKKLILSVSFSMVNCMAGIAVLKSSSTWLISVFSSLYVSSISFT